MIRIDGCWHGADEVSHVWYRRPEQLKDQRFDSSAESRYALAEWAEFVECFFAHIPEGRWINHPARNASASRKLEQLTTAKAIGFKVPDTLATQEAEELRAFYHQHRGQIVVKPLSSGHVERPGEEQDCLIYTNRVLEEHLQNLDDLALCPTLFQQYVQKRCDVRVTVLDSETHAVELLAADQGGGQRCDIRRNNMSDVRYRSIGLPQDVKGGIRRLMNHYGLRFAAIDMAVSTDGEWYFLEVNPNGQWAWLDMCAGLDIAASFVKCFSETAREVACVM